MQSSRICVRKHDIHSKIIRHAKKQKNINQDEEKNQPIKANQELPEMVDLGKGIKSVTSCTSGVSKVRRDIRARWLTPIIPPLWEAEEGIS